jgi:phosphonate transport system substrate-binding protein
MVLQRWTLTLIIITLGLSSSSCTPEPEESMDKLIIGIVNYDTQTNSIDKYDSFKQYLSERTKTFIELEPTFNELNAVQQVKRKVWSIVFAPPGLAAIAISQAQYSPILPMQTRQGSNNIRSVIVVRKESPIQNLADLNNKIVALGQPGSATGYYLPLYDLYGLTLQEIRFAPTPETSLQWLSQKNIDAAALSEDDFQLYRYSLSSKFKIIHYSRFIPPGLVLAASNLEIKKQQEIVRVMKEATSSIANDAGYLINSPMPDYQQLIEIINKVKPIEANVKKQPASLTIK